LKVPITDTEYTMNIIVLGARSPAGNTKTGGNIIYTGADVVEYKTDKIPLNQWKTYSARYTLEHNKPHRPSLDRPRALYLNLVLRVPGEISRISIVPCRN